MPHLPCVDEQPNLSCVFLQCSEAHSWSYSETEAKVPDVFWLSFSILQRLDGRENEDTETAGSVVSLQSSVNSVTLVIQLPSAP